MPSHLRLSRLVVAVGLLAVACTTVRDGRSASPSADDVGRGDTPSVALADWDAVLADARGQTVRWWMFGGDDRVNRFVDDHVVPAAEELGVTLQRVPVADTADAVQRVVAEAQADAEGSVDLIWINGENFALGKRAGLWLPDWAGQLPNAVLVDPATVATDFGVPVDGQESPWSRALFVYAHDTARMPTPPRTFDQLLELAQQHPGRFAYPAPPDFTGSAFVRQVVQALGEDAAFDWLRTIQPRLWQQGSTYPGSEAELNQLFANGQVHFAMSYDPGFVETAVRQGIFPDTVRPFVLEHGTLHNVSFVTIPANAGSRSGALVVANLLLSPALQAAKADPEVLGVPTVLDLDRLDAADAAMFEHVHSPWLLDDPGELVAELPVDEVDRLEARWRAEVLQ